MGEADGAWVAAVPARVLIFARVALCHATATCIEHGKLKPVEVIEFPTVFIDTTTGEVVAEFHQCVTQHPARPRSVTRNPHTQAAVRVLTNRYVRPVVHPALSDFCTELTGIQQAWVDASDTFPDVLAAHTAFVQERGLEDTLYVTCGDWVSRAQGCGCRKDWLPAAAAVAGLSHAACVPMPACDVACVGAGVTCAPGLGAYAAVAVPDVWPRLGAARAPA